MNDELLMEVLYFPHISEKSTQLLKNNNTVIMKVGKITTKTIIKTAIQRIYGIEVKSINSVIVKDKKRSYGKKYAVGKGSRSYKWKKAYISFQNGSSIDSIIKSTSD
ncbi:MAG: 50S ribosomal protein L23 [Candidatus Dasytiphilus stammeri]